MAGLPEKLQKVESETMVCVLDAKLEEGRTVTETVEIGGYNMAKMIIE